MTYDRERRLRALRNVFLATMAVFALFLIMMMPSEVTNEPQFVDVVAAATTLPVGQPIRVSQLKMVTVLRTLHGGTATDLYTTLDELIGVRPKQTLPEGGVVRRSETETTFERVDPNATVPPGWAIFAAEAGTSKSLYLGMGAHYEAERTVDVGPYIEYVVRVRAERRVGPTVAISDNITRGRHHYWDGEALWTSEHGDEGGATTAGSDKLSTRLRSLLVEAETGFANTGVTPRPPSADGYWSHPNDDELWVHLDLPHSKRDLVDVYLKFHSSPPFGPLEMLVGLNGVEYARLFFRRVEWDVALNHEAFDASYPEAMPLGSKRCTGPLLGPAVCKPLPVELEGRAYRSGRSSTVMARKWYLFDRSNTSSAAVICHHREGQPGLAHTVHVPFEAVAAHWEHGDYKGACDGQTRAMAVPDPKDPPDEITLCHSEPLDPGIPVSFRVPLSELPMHAGHGDAVGPCPIPIPKSTWPLPTQLGPDNSPVIAHVRPKTDADRANEAAARAARSGCTTCATDSAGLTSAWLVLGMLLLRLSRRRRVAVRLGETSLR